MGGAGILPALLMTRWRWRGRLLMVVLLLLLLLLLMMLLLLHMHHGGRGMVVGRHVCERDRLCREEYTSAGNAMNGLEIRKSARSNHMRRGRGGLTGAATPDLLVSGRQSLTVTGAAAKAKKRAKLQDEPLKGRPEATSTRRKGIFDERRAGGIGLTMLQGGGPEEAAGEGRNDGWRSLGETDA